MDFFDTVPENFFSLLASKNKRIYLSCIMEAFKLYETGSILGIDKKLVVDELVFFLDSRFNQYTVEDEEDEEANPESKRDLANYVLRKMEECGWIYVDITNDYEEILNFSDTAITMCEAFMKCFPQFEYGDELPEDFINPNEYQGFIYTIYSLLNQSDNGDYALTFSLVYSNTKQLIRSIRKLDSRMKDYIKSVIDTSEIKDLIERLVFYKSDVYDSSYMKLKVGDNISRYRLAIVTKLREYQDDSTILEMVAKNYLPFTKTADEALRKANRDIDEVIDAFNAIEEFITEIDNKNKTYVNSTIGKIKFLLSEEDNVIGKINRILKYIKDQNKKGRVDSAMRVVDGLYEFRTVKHINENSLFVPRGGYKRNYNQVLDDTGFDFQMDSEFLEQFRTAYNEVEIGKFLDYYMVNNVLHASNVIEYDSDDDTVIMLVYCIILAVDKNYKVEIGEDYIQHKKFKMKDFIIERR